MSTEQLDHIKQLFKFSWSQAFSDQNGKSSILPVAGGYITFIGGLGFMYGAIVKDPNLVTQSVMMTTLGTASLLGRKIVNGKPEDLPGTDKPNEGR